MAIARTKAEQATTASDLPVRIASMLAEQRPSSTFYYAIKTALKPDATVPIVWAILLQDALLLSTTHARRWLWREFVLREVNTIRLTADAKSMQIISNDIQVPDLFLPLPSDVPPEWVERFLAAFNQLRLEDRP